MGIISKRERKIFDEMSTDKDLNRIEFGGGMDWEKKKGKPYLEKFTTIVGDENEIFIDIDFDFENYWHSHPISDIHILSFEDVQGILENPKQKSEVLLHNGNALVVTKPMYLNKPKFLREYKTVLDELLKRGASSKEFIRKLSRVLKKYHFKLSFSKKGKQIKVPLKKIY